MERKSSIISGLVSLIISGSTILGPIEQSRADYFEDFETNAGWVTNDPSRMYQTSFEGDGVLRAQPVFMQDPPYNNQAYSLMTHNGDSFTLEWDSYIESKEETPPFIMFGIWNTDFLFDYAFGLYSGDTIISFLQGTGRGLEIPGFRDKWIHNVLNYQTLSSPDFGLLEFSVYDGKQNRTNLLGSISQYASYKEPSTERLGVTFSNSGQLDPTKEYSITYVDNVSFTVPEPASVSLFALGAIALSQRRKDFSKSG